MTADNLTEEARAALEEVARAVEGGRITLEGMDVYLSTIVKGLDEKVEPPAKNKNTLPPANSPRYHGADRHRGGF